jgi:hypothetical protein
MLEIAQLVLLRRSTRVGHGLRQAPAVSRSDIE